MGGLAAALAKALEDPSVRARIVPPPEEADGLWEAAVLAQLPAVLPRLAAELTAADERLTVRRAGPARW
jgi:hypothetical protein